MKHPPPARVKSQVVFILSALASIALGKWEGQRVKQYYILCMTGGKKSQTDRVPYFPRCVFTRPSSLREWLNVISRMPSIRGKSILWIRRIFFFSVSYKKCECETRSRQSLGEQLESEQMTRNFKSWRKKRRKGKRRKRDCVFAYVLTGTHLLCIKRLEAIIGCEREGEYSKNPFMAHSAHTAEAPSLYKMASANAFWIMRILCNVTTVMSLSL